MGEIGVEVDQVKFLMGDGRWAVGSGRKERRLKYFPEVGNCHQSKELLEVVEGVTWCVGTPSQMIEN